MNSTSLETTGNSKTITVRTLVTLEQALERLSAGNPLRMMHVSQLDKGQKRAIVIGLLTEDIGVVDYDYGDGVKAELVPADAQAPVQEKVSRTVNDARKHVYDHMM